MSPRTPARLFALVGAAVVLASCRVDTTISLKVNPNGSGNVTVVAVADPALVSKAPNLAADIRVDDLKNAGWSVLGPTAGKDGSLSVTLTHAFRTPSEATGVLAQVNGPGGPLRSLGLARTGKNTNSTWTLSGRLEVAGGMKAFADDATVQLLGGAPYAEDIKAMGIDIGDAVGISFNASLPGKVDTTTGVTNQGIITWKVPMDGSATDVATTSTNVDVASSISRFVRIPVLILLVVWVVGALVLFMMVRNARTRRPRTPRF